MKIKRSVLNRKGDVEELPMGLAALAFVIVLAALSAYYFGPARGNALKAGAAIQVQREYSISTTNNLAILLVERDDFGITYSTLIERAIDTPNSMHPGGKTFSSHLSETLKPKICDWLEKRIGKNNHHFRILSGTEEKLTCGVTPQAESLFIESQFLPLNNGGTAEVSLEIWAS